jgi:ribosome maturation factor RimP
VRRDEIEAMVRDLAHAVCQQLGLILVDCAYRKSNGDWRILVRIDRPAGVRIDDCAEVSRRLSDRLDEADPIDSQYTLEVSSVGLSEPLRTDQDLERFLGRQVEIDLHPGRGQARAGGKPGKAGPAPVIGKLLAYNPHHLKVEVGDAAQLIDRGAIRRARPAVDFRGTGVEERES